MGCSRIDYNGETLMDISGDTVTEDTLAQGETAHNSNGEQIVGKAVFGGGGSSDVLMIPCYLLISRMQVRAENDQLIVTTQDIVEAFNSNKAIYLKVDVMQFVAEDDKPHMNFSYVIMPLTQCASTIAVATIVA